MRDAERPGREGCGRRSKKLTSRAELQFWYILAEKFGTPVDVLQRTMPSLEFTRWVAYYSMNPHTTTDMLLDRHFARLIRMLDAALTGESRPLSNYLLLAVRRRKQTPAEMLAIMEGCSRAAV